MEKGVAGEDAVITGGEFSPSSVTVNSTGTIISGSSGSFDDCGGGITSLQKDYNIVL